MKQQLASEHVLLIGPDGGFTVEPATLTVRGSQIDRVERGLESGPRVTRIDGLVAPSWVNAHTHLSLSSLRGVGGRASMEGNVIEDVYFRLEGSLTPNAVQAFTTLAAAEARLSGTGTVWDHYYHGASVVDGCRAADINVVMAPTLQDIRGPGVPQLADQLALTERIHNDVHLRDRGVVAAFGPHAPDTVSGSLLQTVAERAGDLGLPVHLHAAQSIEEVRTMHQRANTLPVRWLRDAGLFELAPHTLLVHALFVRPDDLAGVDRDRFTLVHCPASQMQYAFPAPVEQWFNRGYRVVLATDCGACNDTLNLQAELRLMASGPAFHVGRSQAYQKFRQGGSAELVANEREARFASGIPDVQGLLATITHLPGDLHPHLRVGRLAAGYRADLVVYDLQHPNLWPATDPLRMLVFQDAAPAIHQMMRGGRWLSEPGDHVRSVTESQWYRDALTEARGHLHSLLA